MKTRPGVQVVCADVFAAELEAGSARLVYADPPYTEEDMHGYGSKPDWAALVGRMLELGAPDCAYVLHCGAYSLGDVLPAVEALAPKRTRNFAGQPKWRVMPWVKPWKQLARPNVPFQYLWEPVVVFYGGRYKLTPGSFESEADWICSLRPRSKGRRLAEHPTRKPVEVLVWLFDRLLAGAEGRLAVDLYAGTGTAARLCHDRYGMRAVAVERDRGFCDTILQLVAGQAGAVERTTPLAVEVNPHGQPQWHTLGRELWRDLLPQQEAEVVAR